PLVVCFPRSHAAPARLHTLSLHDALPILLCGVRALLGNRADAALDRVHDWAVKNVTSAFSWAVGIIGALIALNTAGPALAWLTGDRKSTRLNSSHVSISYAVFCLKKKNRV